MTWESDAALAGQLDRGHKVYLTMLVARCVDLSDSGVSINFDTSSKTSAKTFADHSGVSTNTVKAYLKTWDAMAEDGIVPPRNELSPGLDVELPDQDKWRDYYRSANAVTGPDRRQGKPERDAGFIHAIHTGLSKKNIEELSPRARELLRELLTAALKQLEEL